MSRRLKAPVPVAEVPAQRREERRLRTGAPGQCCDDFYIEDLLIGDAGVGSTFYQNYTFYSQLIPDDPAGQQLEKFTRRQMLTQGMSTDNRPRFWEVSFYGTDIIFDNADTERTANEIIEIVNFGCNNAAIDIRSNPESCPTLLQGVAAITDPSGGRFQPFDVTGKRSFDVISDAVQAGFLIPDNSYRVVPSQATSKGVAAQQEAYNGIVALSNVGVRIAPLLSNTGQVPDRVSCCLTIPASTTRTICWPPSAHEVEFHWPTDGTQASLSAEYSVNVSSLIDGSGGADRTIAPIVIPAAGGRAPREYIINSSGITVTNSDPVVPARICFVALLEP